MTRAHEKTSSTVCFVCHWLRQCNSTVRNNEHWQSQWHTCGTAVLAALIVFATVTCQSTRTQADDKSDATTTGFGEMVTKVIALKRADASAIASALHNMLWRIDSQGSFVTHAALIVPEPSRNALIIRVAEEELPQLESLIALFDSSDAGQTGVVAVLPGGETVRAENAETLKFLDITIRKSTVLHGNISGYEELKITTDAMTRKTYFIYFLKAGDEQLLVQTVKSVFNWGNDLNYGVYRPAKAMIFYGLEPGMPQEIDVLVEKLDSQSPAANASQPTPPRQPGSIAAIEDSQPVAPQTELKIFPLKNADVRDLAELINILFSGWIESAIADPRTNSLLVRRSEKPDAGN